MRLMLLGLAAIPSAQFSLTWAIRADAFAHRVDLSQSVRISQMTNFSMTPGLSQTFCTDSNFDTDFSCDTPYGKAIFVRSMLWNFIWYVHILTSDSVWHMLLCVVVLSLHRQVHPRIMETTDITFTILPLMLSGWFRGFFKLSIDSNELYCHNWSWNSRQTNLKNAVYSCPQ